MNILKKLAPVFRGLATIFAALLALLVAAVPVTHIPEVETAIDNALGQSHTKDIEEEFTIPGTNITTKTITSVPCTPEWEGWLDSAIIGLGVATGVLGAAWLAAEVVPMFGEKKEEN